MLFLVNFLVLETREGWTTAAPVVWFPGLVSTRVCHQPGPLGLLKKCSKVQELPRTYLLSAYGQTF